MVSDIGLLKCTKKGAKLGLKNKQMTMNVRVRNIQKHVSSEICDFKLNNKQKFIVRWRQNFYFPSDEQSLQKFGLH